MSEEQVKQFIEQATQSLQGGKFQEAVDLINQAIGLDEKNSEAHVLRGIALSQLGQAENATGAFRDAIMHSPYNPKAYYNLAVHYFSLGEKVQAEEMAREAIRIDPKHTGARDLLSKIEAARTPNTNVNPTQPQQPNYGDPLAQPTPPPGDAGPASVNPLSGAPMASGPADPMPPTAAPSQPQAPQQPQAPYGAPQQPYGGAPQQPTGYYRPGYETSNVHSLTFVANMGKTWDTIGIVLAVASLALTIITWVVSGAQMMEMFSNPQAAQNANPFMMGGNMVLSLISTGVSLGSLTWMIMELVDRRGNWLWLLPYILCCCCGLQSIPKLIYIFKGRN